MTVSGRAQVVGDAGRVTGERQERPDPEVPERGRRRTFIAQYKLDVVAEYDAAATGEKGAGTGVTGPARRRPGPSRSRTLSGSSRGRWPQPNGRRSWMRCTRNGSRTLARPRHGRRCWMRAPTSSRCQSSPVRKAMRTEPLVMRTLGRTNAAVASSAQSAFWSRGNTLSVAMVLSLGNGRSGARPSGAAASPCSTSRR